MFCFGQDVLVEGGWCTLLQSSLTRHVSCRKENCSTVPLEVATNVLIPLVYSAYARIVICRSGGFEV